VDDDRKRRHRRKRIERQSREPLVGLRDRLLLFGAAGRKQARREHGANSGSLETSIGAEHRMGCPDSANR
jgi:hypothetical protein